MKHVFTVLISLVSLSAYAQVDTSFIYNANRPYGTLDIRIAKSSTQYYYLQEGVTFSYREDASGVRTNTFRDMTSWDSSPYAEGNLREKSGNTDTFIMNYRLLFPSGYQPNYSEGYPMIVMMHGAGERGNCWDYSCYWDTPFWRPSVNSPAAPVSSSHELLNNDHNLSHGGKQHLDARNLAGTRLPNDNSLPQRSFPGFVLFPQNLNGWDTSPVHDAIRLVRLVAKKYNVDPNRIYVHGLSNGGIATYNLIKRAPWLFAAALPMSSPTESAVINQGMLPEIVHIPIWTFQGGQDVAPTPSRTESYVRVFRESGADVRYTRYDHLGHGTWNTAYGESDFFSWMRAKSKRNIHIFYGSTELCSSGAGVKMGLSAGFLAYQWQRDGVIISGATSHEYTATVPGVYRARFSRLSRTPTSGQWEEWSTPVTITASGNAKASIEPLTTTHLRGPDNATPNVIRLKSVAKADSYRWYRNGIQIDIPANNLDDTVRVLSISATSASNNGAYTLRTGNAGGCLSQPSDAVNLFFDNSAPVLADSNIPTSFRSVATTGSSVTLAWDDRSSVETAYEVWRRAPGGVFEFAGRVSPNATTFTDRGLLPSTAYEYKIRMLNNSGRSRYAPGDNVSTNLVVNTAADTQAPSAPQSLQVSRNTTSSISLSWTPSTDNNGAISHYVIYYGSQSQSTNSSAPSYILTGLPSNTNYTITVKAVDNAGLFSPASNPVTASTTVTGLWYGHSTGAWTSLDQITTWDQPEFTGWVPNFTLTPTTQDEYFNFSFEGYLYIAQAGSYNFYLNSDDGSRLYIDGNTVVNFDGVHGRSSANGGFGLKSVAPVTLTAGAHAIRVIYLEYTGGQSLTVAYQGPDTGNEIVEIPDEALTSGVSAPPGGGCENSGQFTHEVWTGIPGVMISSIPVNEEPDQSRVITLFEAPQNIADNYGSRMRGYICPPTTGNYVFWISGNDITELWISTNDNPANRRRIAYTDGYTNVRQWDKYTTQQSLPIALVANQRYYIEALHKEGVGTDHVAVGWRMPNGTLERPIPGMRLIPFESDGPPDGESPCAGNGTVSRELWTNVRNADIASIPVGSIPDAVSELTIFEIPSNIGDNYATRVSGYICAPQTGNYTFWIASNDQSELWLSTDDNPSNKQRIAYAYGATNPRQWTKFASQQSTPISLVSGQRYYIEALHKEGVGTDHLAVGWQLPDGTQERPIPGSRLSPFETSATAIARMMEESVSVPDIFPNPAGSNTDVLTIRTSQDWNAGDLSSVEILRVTGETVYTGKLTCNGQCDEYSVPVTGILAPGVYIINMFSQERRMTKRLLVK